MPILTQRDPPELTGLRKRSLYTESDQKKSTSTVGMYIRAMASNGVNAADTAGGDVLETLPIRPAPTDSVSIADEIRSAKGG